MSDHTTSKATLDRTTLKHLERRMYIVFGSMIGLIVLILLLASGAYFQYSLSKAQEDLSTILTRILADSVSRISFTGKYQSRLLLEDIKRQQPEIHYLLVADKNGEILAHSDPVFNDTHLDTASMREANKVLHGSPREIRTLYQNALPLREVTLPYYAGFDHQLAGVIQVGVSDKKLLSAVVRGGWFALILGASLLTAGLTICFIYINNQFVRPVRLMAAQLEGILTNAPTLIAIRNRNGELVTCSNTFRTFFGLDPDEQQITNERLYSPEEAAMMDHVVATIRDNCTPLTFEITASEKTGTPPRTFLVNGFPILSEQGEVQLIGSFSIDLTDLRLTEQALRKSLTEAQRASEAKSEFLSRMSHELRTPLNAIIGFSQVLQNDPVEQLTEEQQDNVDEILRAGRHLLELINEILDLARVESGHLTISLEPVSIINLFEECSSLIIPLANQQKITINYLPCCPQGKTTCQLLCDPLRTRQVLLNLLSNAVKYNRDNGTVNMACTRMNNGFCRVTVQDTGNGINEQFLPRLFEPFVRAVRDGNSIEGTGIGLALVKHLIEAMGGRVGVESVEGQGSTFWFELASAGRTELDQEEPDDSDQKQAIPLSSDNSRYTILSVEDNQANQRLIRKLLATRQTITLLEAENAEDALELVHNCRIDLILMDINLPGMNGFTALAELKKSETTRAIPVLAVSANALQSEVDKALAAGFGAYLTKPLDVNQLLEKIDDHIHFPPQRKNCNE